MPVLATQSTETKTNDVQEQESAVQLKDVKDGLSFSSSFILIKSYFRIR